jgi:hypothetical protein
MEFDLVCGLIACTETGRATAAAVAADDAAAVIDAAAPPPSRIDAVEAIRFTPLTSVMDVVKVAVEECWFVCIVLIGGRLADSRSRKAANSNSRVSRFCATWCMKQIAIVNKHPMNASTAEMDNKATTSCSALSLLSSNSSKVNLNKIIILSCFFFFVVVCFFESCCECDEKH